MSEPVLRTEELTKRFGGLTAVDNLSFSLAGWRLACHHRAERRRQDHVLQSGLGPAARRRAAACSSTAATSPASSRTRSAGSASSARLQIKSVFPQLTVAENLWITGQAGRGFLHPFRAAARDRDTRAKWSSERSSRSGLRSLAQRPGRHAVLRRRGAARDRHGADLRAAAASARRADLRDEPGRDRARGWQEFASSRARSISSSSSTTWRSCSRSPTTSP